MKQQRFLSNTALDAFRLALDHLTVEGEDEASPHFDVRTGYALARVGGPGRLLDDTAENVLRDFSNAWNEWPLQPEPSVLG